MFRKRLPFLLLVLMVTLVLAGCQARQSNEETAVPPPNPPAVAMDDGAMSRLRLASLVFGGPDVDLYVDGQIAKLGSGQRELTQVPAGFITGFLYVEPGMHTAAIVPAGGALEESLVTIDVTLEEGHRYTVLAMGQKGDSTSIPLVIDETTAVEQVRTSPEQDIMLLVNNLHGADYIDFIEDGSGPTNVMYGGFVAAPIQAGHVDHLSVTVNGDQILEAMDDISELPAVDFIHSYSGNFPGEFESSIFWADSNWISDLSARDLLEQFTDYANSLEEDPREFSFSTFLNALDVAGLGDVLTTGTYVILAPTDAAFDSVPSEELEALLADPAALNAYLRNYIIEGYYPQGALSGTMYGLADRSLTNLQGGEVRLLGNLSVNGVFMGERPKPTAANGTSVVPLSKLFLPLSPENESS